MRLDHFPLDQAEVRGFALGNVGPLAPRSRLSLPRYIPVIHGGNDRATPLATPWAALPINRVCTRKSRRRFKVRFATKAEFLAAFGLAPGTRLLFLGIGKDRYLERYWAHKNDDDAAGRLATAGFDAAVAPNFSFFLEEPRTQHMHARKRSLLCASDFAQAGIAPVIYLHALTAADWRTWADFLRERKDVTMVCKEFQTGGAAPERGYNTICRIAELEQRLGRALHFVAVGGARFVPYLSRELTAWTIVDSSPYMCAVKRKRGHLADGAVRWDRAHGAAVDDLLAANVACYHSWVGQPPAREARIA